MENVMLVHHRDRSHVLEVRFLALLPALRHHAQIVFRNIPCSDTRDDKIAESVALAWKCFRALAERGKPIERFRTTFLFTVIRAVRNGRRLLGMEKSKDAMSGRAQRRHHFAVLGPPTDGGLPLGRPGSRASGEEGGWGALGANAVTPVPVQAAFRIDWRRFFARLSSRDRRMARFLALGNTGSQTAAAFGLTQGRVSQLRRQWHDAWTAFQER
jgi:hypothetical protein